MKHFNIGLEGGDVYFRCAGRQQTASGSVNDGSWHHVAVTVNRSRNVGCLYVDAVLKSCEVLTAEWGFAWSPKRITVSSVGVRGKLERFLNESECHVAISMHSPLHEQRLALMPAEKAMPIEETVALLKRYAFTHQRRCSFEYICFGGLNDSLQHGQAIVRLVQGLECRVNLIRFHAIPGVDLPASDPLSMEKLRDYLTNHGVYSTIRASRGEDILAACGLLSTARNDTHNNQV